MQDENEISAIPLAEAKPPAGHAWAVRRRAGDVSTYLVACNLKRPLWVGPQASAKQYGDLRIAGIAASWLVQHGNVPPDELSIVPVPLLQTSPVRERMIARTVRRARQLSVEADSELDVYDARNRIMKNAVAQVERDKQHKQAGFAMLLEVLVLCAIMLALCAALAPNMVKAGRALNYKAARQRAQAVWQSRARIAQPSTTCFRLLGLPPVPADTPSHTRPALLGCMWASPATQPCRKLRLQRTAFFTAALHSAVRLTRRQYDDGKT
jgi:hypothetical protein